jgi:formate hydrogenlyase subunit 6/NADH:ubiquinone oxidoreductase subunit I
MGIFKLGTMTLGSMFKKPETVLYPTEQKSAPAGLKGHIVVEAEKCILCGMCARSCTTGTIAVDKEARTWSIGYYQCIQCGYCVQVCPKNCLRMEPSYWKCGTEKTVETTSIPEQEKAEAGA